MIFVGIDIVKTNIIIASWILIVIASMLFNDDSKSYSPVLYHILN